MNQVWSNPEKTGNSLDIRICLFLQARDIEYSVVSNTNLQAGQLPSNARMSINPHTYANDFHLFVQYSNTSTALSVLSSYLDNLHKFLTSRSLVFSSNVSASLLFSLTKVLSLIRKVERNSTIQSFENHPKLLTAYLYLSFPEHCKRTSSKAASRISILKALSETSCDQSKETLLVTFKALVKPILDYASPTSSHAASKKFLNKLQLVQTAAFRVITGSTKNKRYRTFTFRV